MHLCCAAAEHSIECRCSQCKWAIKVLPYLPKLGGIYRDMFERKKEVNSLKK